MSTTGKVLLTVLLVATYVVEYTLVEGCVHQVSLWYNNSHPNAVNRSETEPQPAAHILDILCPKADGGKLSIECTDSNSSNPSRYGCNVNIGALCHAPANSTALCPDVAIRYTCNCPTTRATRTTHVSRSRTQSSQTKQSTSGSPPRTQSSQTKQSTPGSPLMTSPSGHNGAGRASMAPSSGWLIMALWYLWSIASVTEQ